MFQYRGCRQGKSYRIVTTTTFTSFFGPQFHKTYSAHMEHTGQKSPVKLSNEIINDLLNPRIKTCAPIGRYFSIRRHILMCIRQNGSPTCKWCFLNTFVCILTVLPYISYDSTRPVLLQVVQF